MIRFAIALPAILAMTTTLTGTAVAQSSSGNIVGEAGVGDVVHVTGTDTGFKRELKISRDGRYQLRRVPTGDYQVVRVRKDGTVGPVQTVVVRPGGTARVMDADAAEKARTSGE